MHDTVPYVIFDLDGTLSLTHHREHHVRGKVKDWDAFYEACDQDAPNTNIIALTKIMHEAGLRVHIMSGRSKQVIKKTIAWLHENEVYYDSLQMREEGDFTPDDELKKGWVLDYGIPPVVVFDDRNKVVRMWRSLGITCCQVAEGDF